MNVLQWVGIIGVAWVAIAVLVAVVWHRAKKARPRIVRRDGTPITKREVDAIRRIAELDRDLRGGA